MRPILHYSKMFDLDIFQFICILASCSDVDNVKLVLLFIVIFKWKTCKMDTCMLGLTCNIVTLNFFLMIIQST